MKLILGGIEVPIHASLALRQTYEGIGGSTLLRMQSGAGVKQTHWRKLRTTIQGDGWIPPGLVALDYSQALVLSCIAPRSIVVTAPACTVPAARRTDAGYVPAGFALVGEAWVPTAVALDVDAATLTPVAGAQRYMVMYYPEITVFADEPQEDVDAANAAYRWSLTAEEI